MVFRFLVQRYIYHLHHNPWPTNIITTGVTISIGDFIAQYVIEGRSFEKYDIKRTAHFAVVGCCLAAPSLLIWYRTLDKIVKGKTILATAKKIILDQALYSPYILATFFVSIDALNHKSLYQIQERFKKDYINTQINAYKFWPIAQTLNFCFVPSVYRILFLRGMAIIWNSYLSWSIHRRNFKGVNTTKNVLLEKEQKRPNGLMLTQLTLDKNKH